jgi:hypothetical protein
LKALTPSKQRNDASSEHILTYITQFASTHHGQLHVWLECREHRGKLPLRAILTISGAKRQRCSGQCLCIHPVPDRNSVRPFPARDVKPRRLHTLHGNFKERAKPRLSDSLTWYTRYLRDAKPRRYEVPVGIPHEQAPGQRHP